MEISQRIKVERQTAKWTQEDLADKIFVSKRTISNWETGKTVPDIESILLLAKVFHVSLDDLLFENSVVVKEIKRKEEIVNLSWVYFIGPVLTAILLIVMMYSLSEMSNTGVVAFIGAVSLSNLFTLCVFKGKLAQLKGNEEKFKKELKQMKMVGIVTLILACLFTIALHFI
jgi:Predicted transcriptional regulators